MAMARGVRANAGADAAGAMPSASERRHSLQGNDGDAVFKHSAGGDNVKMNGQPQSNGHSQGDVKMKSRFLKESQLATAANSVRGVRTLDVTECYDLHRKLTNEWWPNYEDYIKTFLDLKPTNKLVLAPNRFRYDLMERQWVLWSLDGEFQDDVSTFASHELGFTPTQIFENAPCDRSVPGLRHLHIRGFKVPL